MKSIAYSKYSYCNFAWYGLSIETSPDIKKEAFDLNEWRQMERDSYHYEPYMFIDPATNYPEQVTQYVVLSNYLVLEETVFGPPRSYIECFTEIMNRISAQIDHAKSLSSDEIETTIREILTKYRILKYSVSI